MYLALKAVHIVAVVLFLGNIITGVFWKSYADGTRDPRLMAHAIEGIIRSDRYFTVPGVLLIVLAGVGAAMAARIPILSTGWILWSIGLLSLSGICFGTRIAPLQREMLGICRAAIAGAPLDMARYAQLTRSWLSWGTIAIAAPIAAVALMVMKPSLPG